MAYEMQISAPMDRARRADTPALVSRSTPGDEMGIYRVLWRIYPAALIRRIQHLGSDHFRQGETVKALGYGDPIRIDADIDGVPRSFVLHGVRPNAFGHERRADRAAEALLAPDTRTLIPQHSRVLDFGAYRSNGTSVSLRDTGEFYLPELAEVTFE